MVTLMSFISGTTLSVMLSVIMLSVVMLRVIVLGVVMLRVVVPKKDKKNFR